MRGFCFLLACTEPMDRTDLTIGLSAKRHETVPGSGYLPIYMVLVSVALA